MEPPREAATGEFAVQVFAFSDDKGANSLVNKLKGKGYPAYSEPVNTSRGTLWRVRVGPFPSREGAAAARERLKGEGYNGIVASAK
jgi:DedD protein